MQGLPQTPKGPLVKLLVEGFHSPCTACIVWSSGAIVNLSTLLTRTTNHHFSSLSACMSEGGVRCKGCPRHLGL
jgi:hypothetical protein